LLACSGKDGDIDTEELQSMILVDIMQRLPESFTATYTLDTSDYDFDQFVLIEGTIVVTPGAIHVVEVVMSDDYEGTVEHIYRCDDDTCEHLTMSFVYDFDLPTEEQKIPCWRPGEGRVDMIAIHNDYYTTGKQITIPPTTFFLYAMKSLMFPYGDAELLNSNFSYNGRSVAKFEFEVLEGDYKETVYLDNQYMIFWAYELLNEMFIFHKEYDFRIQSLSATTDTVDAEPLCDTLE
jgi:hypothetical protein